MKEVRSFEEFKNEVVGKIREFLPESFASAEVSLQVVRKNNDLQLTGLTIRSTESNICPTIYLEKFYDEYVEGADMSEILERIAEVPLFITTLFVNIPLFAAAGRKMGFKFLSSSLLASALYTVFLGVLENVPHLIIDDILVSAAVSGVLTGAGLGITIKSGATTGGTDMLAMLIKNYKPHIKPATVINITDGAIILAGAALLGAERSFYAILSVAVSTFVMTRILEGGSAAKRSDVYSRSRSV